LAAHSDVEQYWVTGVGHYRMFRSEPVRRCIVQLLTT